MFATIVLSGLAFALLKPITVLPQIRPAPGYALTDQHGGRVTSEDGRGEVTLYTFVPLDCGDRCDEVDRTMAEVQRRVERDVDLNGVPFRLVTVALEDAPTTSQLAAAAERAGAGDSWSFVGGDEAAITNVVALGFERPARLDDDGSFQPSYAIVDGWGVIRGEYRYSTVNGHADRLVSHLDILGSELRNGGGIARLAYSAAHVFQCYP